MAAPLTLAELKSRALSFINKLGNDLDTTSPGIVGLLADEFAVQHGELPPSTGGRDVFLTNLGERLKMAKGMVSVEIKHVVAELYEDSARGGQCWVYSRKNTPFGCSNSLDMMTFNAEGKIVLCQDLHGPKEDKWIRILSWIIGTPLYTANHDKES